METPFSSPSGASVPVMTDLAETLDAVAAESTFSGVVRVDRGDEVVLETAYGFADRRWEIPNAPDTRFAMASGVKGMTALAVMSLVEVGVLDLTTTARSVLGDDLPLIDDAVTVEQLLAHRSGIGDYVDEDLPGEITDYLLPVPVHTLAETEEYVAVLGGFPAKFPPGERFSYCNGGFVVLALVAERASGTPFRELVARNVCEPAGMTDTAFLRSDELPEGTGVGYLRADGLRTNVLHLPVRGTGDGGAYTTAADMRRFWVSFFAGRIVSETLGAGDDAVAQRHPRRREALRPRLLAPCDDRHRVPDGPRRRRLFQLAPQPT